VRGQEVASLPLRVDFHRWRRSGKRTFGLTGGAVEAGLKGLIQDNGAYTGRVGYTHRPCGQGQALSDPDGHRKPVSRTARRLSTSTDRTPHPLARCGSNSCENGTCPERRQSTTSISAITLAGKLAAVRARQAGPGGCPCNTAAIVSSNARISSAGRDGPTRPRLKRGGNPGRPSQDSDHRAHRQRHVSSGRGIPGRGNGQCRYQADRGRGFVRAAAGRAGAPERGPTGHRLIV
jgi:hypothetical protein